MPRTEEQYEEIREEKKKLIKNTALELVAEQGLHSTTISQISKRAGISKGLLYNYFESKENLITEIIFDGMLNFLNLFDPNKDGVLTSKEFEYFIEQSFQLLKNNTQYYRLYFSIAVQPAVMSIVKDEFMNIVIPLFHILDLYFKSKGFKSPEVEVRLVLAMLDGVCLGYINDPENFPLEQVKDRIIELYK